mgnify:FL=1
MDGRTEADVAESCGADGPVVGEETGGRIVPREEEGPARWVSEGLGRGRRTDRETRNT